MEVGVLIALAVVFGVLTTGGLVAVAVLLVRWSAGAETGWTAGLRAAGFEPVGRLSADLERRLLVMAGYEAADLRVVCPHARRETGYSVLLHGVEGSDLIGWWELVPAVHAPGLRVPRLTLERRSGAVSLGNCGGRSPFWQDGGALPPVRFPEDPTFEAAFDVRGADAGAVRAYLDPTRRSWLSGLGDLALRADGDLFVFARSERSRGRTPPPGERPGYLLEDSRSLLGILWSD